MKSSNTKWLIGGAIAVVLALIAAAAIVPMLATAFFGGFMTQMAGIGALAQNEVSEEEGQCVDPGPGGGAITGSQKEYVRTLIGVAKDLGVSKKGQIIGTMVMFQESGIQNYANSGKNVNGFDIDTPEGTQFWLDVAKLSMDKPHDAVGNDADSVGLFQQRASTGWANTEADKFKAKDNKDEAIERLMNPEFGARGFFGGEGHIAVKGLLDIDGWEDMEMTAAAQKVQGSAFPSAYAKWESKARALVNENQDAPKLDGGGDGGSGSSDDDDSSDDDSGTKKGDFKMPMKEGTYKLTSGFGGREDPVNGGQAQHNGQDFGAPMNTPIYSTADGTVSAAGAANGFGQWIVIDHKVGGKKYSSVYGHIPSSSIKVSEGDKVKAGDQIAGVGTEGKSTGPHLHFEIWDGGRFSNGKAVDPMDVVEGKYDGGGSSGSGGGGNGECDSGDDSDDGVSADGDVGSVIAAGKKQIGVDYSWGGGSLDGPSEGFAQGKGITGFDCSSLMRYMIYQGTGKGYELPRVSTQQYQKTKGNQVAKAGDGVDKLKAGDLMFWGSSGSNLHHVAMYIGDGQMIEAPRTGLKVRITEARVTGDYFGATRIDYSEVGK